MEEVKKCALRVAHMAGKLLLKEFRQDLSLIRQRGLAKEVKLRNDQASNALILRELQRNFLKHNILSEESPFIDHGSSYTWVVDPLDGSSNFARGNPFFAVSIALMKEKEVILGVIHAPFLRETYVAEKGCGAFLNGERIHVSTVSSFSSSYFLSCEGGSKTNRMISKVNGIFLPRVKDLRKLGSAALETAAVAQGIADAYVTLQIAPWDVAAGVLLVQEAGGRASDFKGKNWSAHRGNFVFSNGLLHQKVLYDLRSL